MAEEAADDGPRANVRFKLSDQLPDGMLHIPLEREGEFLWLIRTGHMTPELITEINKTLEHIIGNGLWEQRWGGDPCPPPPHPDTDA